MNSISPRIAAAATIAEKRFKIAGQEVRTIPRTEWESVPVGIRNLLPQWLPDLLENYALAGGRLGVHRYGGEGAKEVQSFQLLTPEACIRNTQALLPEMQRAFEEGYYIISLPEEGEWWCVKRPGTVDSPVQFRLGVREHSAVAKSFSAFLVGASLPSLYKSEPIAEGPGKSPLPEPFKASEPSQTKPFSDSLRAAANLTVERLAYAGHVAERKPKASWAPAPDDVMTRLPSWIPDVLEEFPLDVGMDLSSRSTPRSMAVFSFPSPVGCIGEPDYMRLRMDELGEMGFQYLGDSENGDLWCVRDGAGVDSPVCYYCQDRWNIYEVAPDLVSFLLATSIFDLVESISASD